MSDYCTECIHLKHEKTETDSEHSCGKLTQEHTLTRLCGNPKKHGRCTSENWYEKQKGKTMMTNTQAIAILDAYQNNKKIQVSDDNIHWTDMYPFGKYVEWNFQSWLYRVKPEPKHRPLKPEELITLKSKYLINKGDRCLYLIASIKQNGVGIISNGEYFPEQLLKCWTYEDGTPVGVLE